MHDDDSPLMKAFFLLPFLAGLLFVFNHLDWVAANSDYLLPVGIAGGLGLVYKIFPEVWRSLRTFLPILIAITLICGGVLYLIFGGGADAVVGFGAKAREKHIESLQ